VLIVAAVGGNALLRRNDTLDAEVAQRNAKIAAESLAEIARDHDLVITHGNGPQIGLLALQSEAFRDVRTYPLDVLGAQSEGMIGYLLEQELGNVLDERPVASLVTQTVVDALDPAFHHPTKPIGPLYPPDRAKRASGDGPWLPTASSGGASSPPRLLARSSSCRRSGSSSSTRSSSCARAAAGSR
jgi:carbamate kinase